MSTDDLRLDRERTLSLLYELAMKDTTAAELLDDLPSPPPTTVVATVEGVSANRQQLDEAISKRAVGWDIDRMAVIDLCILRYGAWELKSSPNLPVAVIINEAVDLAKRFSTEESGKFVNGILDALVSDLRT